MKCPGTSKMVLLIAAEKSTVVEIASQLDYQQYNLLITTGEEDAAKIIQREWPDVVILETTDPRPRSEVLSRFLAESRRLLPLILVTGPDGAYPDHFSLQVNEILHRPVNGLELSTRLNAVLHLQQLEQQAKSRVAGSGQPRVLVVEDSPLQRRVLARYLAEQNMEVITASDGLEALKIARRNPPDMVLLDLVLPGVDGFEVCRLLRDNPSTARVPIVIITSHGGREERIRGLEYGADDFLVKPVDQRELIIRTRSLLRRKQLMDSLLSEASHDHLTGLYNRRQMGEEMRRELARAKRYGYSLTVIMLDVDNFKNYNDTQGHQAGDEMLRALAELLNTSTRGADIVCRYGGEEFIIILPQTDLAGGMATAEKIRRLVAAHPFPGGADQPGGRLTISLGVAVYPDHGETAEELIGAADRALYRAKREGKNRTVAAEFPALPNPSWQ